jgi:hypothetical protein
MKTFLLPFSVLFLSLAAAHSETNHVPRIFHAQGEAAAAEKTTDYAHSEHWAAWTHHPVFGDASFDSFERLPGNPVCRGTDEFEWPVNGSLFKDPVSGDWFLYVSWYKKGYANKNGERSHSTVYRSKDKGRTWKEGGEPLTGAGRVWLTGGMG